MSAIETRPATEADFELLYGEATPHSARAWVAVKDNEAIAIGGIYYDPFGRPVLFSRVTDAMRPHKRAIMHCARRLAMVARDIGAVAIPSCKERLSPKLLTRLGMVPVGQCTEGEVYGWPTR